MDEPLEERKKYYFDEKGVELFSTNDKKVYKKLHITSWLIIIKKKVYHQGKPKF